MRVIEKQAREDAEAGKPMQWLPQRELKSYWDQASHQFEAVVYRQAYQKRIARMARMQSHQNIQKNKK